MHQILETTLVPVWTTNEKFMSLLDYGGDQRFVALWYTYDGATAIHDGVHTEHIDFVYMNELIDSVQPIFAQRLDHLRLRVSDFYDYDDYKVVTYALVIDTLELDVYIAPLHTLIGVLCQVAHSKEEAEC